MVSDSLAFELWPFLTQSAQRVCSFTICTPLSLVAAECRAANSALKKVPPHDYPRRIQFQRRRSR